MTLGDIEMSNQGHCVFVGLNILTIYYYTAELSGARSLVSLRTSEYILRIFFK